MNRARARQDGPQASIPREVHPDFLALARSAFAEACAASPSGVETIDLRFAGRPVRMRVAGPLLASQLRRSYRTLITGEAPSPRELPQLIVDAWDRKHSGIGCPGVAYAPDTIDALGGGLLTQFGRGSVIRYERASAISALDRSRAELLYSVRNAAELEVHLLAKPFPELLAIWYRDRGVHQLHAGLVARDGRGVLFAGAAGSGKTTATIACSLAGFDFLGDDHVGIEISDDGALGHAFYACIRTDDDLTSRFHDLGESYREPTLPWPQKAMVCLADLERCRTARDARIDALVVPEVRGVGRTRITAIERATALRRLAPSTLLVPLGGGAPGFAVLAQLVRRVPVFRLEIGDSVEAIPLCIDELLTKL